MRKRNQFGLVILSIVVLVLVLIVRADIPPEGQEAPVVNGIYTVATNIPCWIMAYRSSTAFMLQSNCCCNTSHSVYPMIMFNSLSDLTNRAAELAITIPAAVYDEATNYIAACQSQTTLSVSYWTNTFTNVYFWWDMEGTNTTSTLDIGPNGYHGAYWPSVTSGPTWQIVGTNVNGRVEHAYSFDGADHFYTANGNTFSSGCFMAWVKMEDFSAEHVIIRTRIDIGEGILMSVLPTTRYIQAQIYDGSWKTLQYETAIPSNEWVHISFFWNCNATGTDMRIFTNAVLVATGDLITGVQVTDATYGGSAGGGDYTKGLLDDLIMCWIKPLSAWDSATNDLPTYVLKSHPTNNLVAR